MENRVEQAGKARVDVVLKNGVLDPQGKAIHQALQHLGFNQVRDVRQGKLIELDLTDLAVVLNNFGHTLGGSASPGVAAAVPEPASVALLGAGVVGFLMRRRRT